MKQETIADKVQAEITKATRWLAVSDLKATIQCSTSSIRRSLLRREFTFPMFPGIYKVQKIPGDQHGRNQWALHATDTTGWVNAAPIRSLPKSKKSKKRRATPVSTGSPVQVNQSATYGGITLMCAPTNKSSLVKVVGDLLVNEFVTSGNKFSAFDITKRLRDIVLTEAKNSGVSTLLDLDELGTVFVQGLKVAKVEHDDVKAIVHDIFNAGGMPNLSRMRDVTNAYWEYGPSTSFLVASIVDPQPSSVTGSTTDPDPISGGTMGSTYDGSSTI